MSTCAVTIAGPDSRVDLVVSRETPIAELLPTFLDLVGGANGHAENGRSPVYTLAEQGGQPLPRERTLADCAVTDGAVLVLSELRSAEQAPPKPAETRLPPPEDGGTPLQRTERILPERLPTQRRASLAIQAFFDHEPEPPVTESAEPVVPTTRELVTKPERPGAWQRGRSSWRSTDQLVRLDELIVAPRLLRCATVAVVSPKGGVGKTTVTALLGSLLARLRRDRIVAVDTNPDYGSLGRTLTPEHGVYVDDLLDVLERPNLSVTELDAKLGRASDGLMVLPAPTDPERMAGLDEAAYRHVISRLQDLVGLLVLDCGTGLQEPAARAALSTADQIVLVSDAHPSTASLVAEASELLGRAGPPLTLTVNKMPKPKQAQIDLRGLAALIPDARGLVTVDDDARGARRVAAGAFSWDEAPRGWQRSVRELATLLLADWPRLGISV